LTGAKLPKLNTITTINDTTN